jgi:hypothetical protein
MMQLVESITTSTWIGGFKAVTCKSEKCSRWLTQRQLATRRVGVTLASGWYCSYRCVTAAMEGSFTQLLSVRASRPPVTPGMPLGLMMVSRGLLTAEQLKSATEEQKVQGGDLGDHLVERGLATEAQVATLRAAQWGCPVYSVPAAGASLRIQLPDALKRSSSMVPLHFVAATNKLLVGFAHAIEYAPLYAIEQITGCKTQPCIVTPSDFQAQLMAQASEAGPEQMLLDDVHTPVEMSRVVCNHGVLHNADQIAITRCKDHLWARLESGLKTIDILFDIADSLLPAAPRFM